MKKRRGGDGDGGDRPGAELQLAFAHAAFHGVTGSGMRTMPDEREQALGVGDGAAVEPVAGVDVGDADRAQDFDGGVG